MVQYEQVPHVWLVETVKRLPLGFTCTDFGGFLEFRAPYMEQPVRGSYLWRPDKNDGATMFLVRQLQELAHQTHLVPSVQNALARALCRPMHQCCFGAVMADFADVLHALAAAGYGWADAYHGTPKMAPAVAGDETPTDDLTNEGTNHGQ